MDDLRDPDAFAAFYRGHSAAVAGFFLRRTANAEVAADLTAETFAAAFAGARRYDASRGPVVAWLYGIARHQLAAYERRGRVEDRARRRLGMERLELTPAATDRLESVATAALAALPADQRALVQARVIDQQDYARLAATTGASEPAVRQRVSRALARLRKELS